MKNEKKDEKEEKKSFWESLGQAIVVMIIFYWIWEQCVKSFKELKHNIKTRNYKQLAIHAVLAIIFLSVYYYFLYF